MNRVAISTNSVAPYDWERRLLVFRYKLTKLLSLVPDREKQRASEFEDCGFRERFYQDLWRRAALNLDCHYRELGYGFWSATDDKGNEVRGRGGDLALESNVALQLAGNKPLTHRLLDDLPHYRKPLFREFRLASIDKAQTFMRKQQAPCVVKPARDTGAGRGVITGIHNDAALRRAAVTASMQCKDLLIEETIAGSSYRLLFLGGEYLHGVRRDPPRVTGDGKSTVKELIEAENDRRRRQAERIISFFTITVDQDCRSSLAAQSMELASVPGAGETVQVKRVVNQNGAGDNREISQTIHPTILSTAALANARLGLQLSGVDVLTNDISQPLADTGGVFNEINGTPGLHHHYLTGDNRDPEIAERILRYCMATSSYPHAA